MAESYKIAKDLLAESLSVNEWSKYGQYRYFIRITSYNNCLLKAIVVHHRKSSCREITTMNKNCIKASKNIKKILSGFKKRFLKTEWPLGKK
ncbi:MAG: hypothetical protein HQK53_12670 [Oligoflexia bacterium]|nr:hypothetical protein [Oligoflexia bacterium]